MEESSDKKIILAISDYGTSGIAESLRHQLTHWHNKGHEIWHLALGYDGWPVAESARAMFPWHERLLPITMNGPNDKFAQAQIGKALRMSKAHYVITSFDAWMISYFSNPTSRHDLDDTTKELLAHENREFQHIAYFPLDSAVHNMYLPAGMEEMIAGFDIPVTYSRYAQQIIERDTGLQVPFIPIAHDPNVYKPGDKLESREQFSLENINDKFIVGMVATNQYRKAWGEFFEVVVPFAKAHPDVLILPFTNWRGKIAGGAEIEDLIWRWDIADQTINCQSMVHRLDDTGMANVFRSMDTLLLCTAGEGAGLPPLRSRACGVPALVSNNTSNSEFCADDFERIPVNGHYYDPFGSNLERYTTDVDEMRKRLEILYQNEVMRKELGAKGIQEMQKYELQNVMPAWDNLLENNG